MIVNRGKDDFKGWLPLADDPESVLILDPLTGRDGAAEMRSLADGTTEMTMHIPSGQSLILKTFSERKVEGSAFPFMVEGDAPVTIEGPWTVTFIEGGPTLPDR